MEAIILAGGLGTRLRKVVPDLPKPMAPIQGRPFLEFILTQLLINQFQHVILSLGYQSKIISEYFGSHFSGIQLSYVTEDAPLGTGGGARLALQRSVENHVYLLNGDTFHHVDFGRVEKSWQVSKSLTVIIKRVKDCSRYGGVTIEGGKISGFIEKGIFGPGLISAGCYILPRGAMDCYAPGEPFSFELDYLPQEVAKGVVSYCIEDGYFIDIGIPEDYQRAEFELPKWLTR